MAWGRVQLAWAILLGVGCATGGDTDDGDLSIGLGDDAAEGSTSGPPSTTTGAADDAPPPPADDSTGPSADDTTTGPAGTTDDGGMTTSADTGSVMMCVNDTTCAAAPVLGGVAGDEPSADLMTSGDMPTWVTFQVSENNNDVVGEKLTFTATLTSAPGTDFDLFVFRGPEGGTSGCGGVQGSSANAGSTDSVSMQWGEGAFANNAEDGAWVAVEIRAKADMCMPGADWTLTVQGNT